MRLYDLIEESSLAGMKLQNTRSGAMPGGHNGPYHDPHTPVRNTGHWLMLFLKAHEISGREEFLQAAERALRFLCSCEARPMGAAFYHRTNPEKDTCNGLVGQAWTMETLIHAGEYLGREEYLRLAEEVFLLHPFNRKAGLWQRVAADGMYLSMDATFNHQLWFAAAAAPLAERSEKIRSRVSRFMDRLPENLLIYSSGLIYHALVLHSAGYKTLRKVKRLLKPRPGERQAIQIKSVGYHSFNLYAFGMLQQVNPDHSFWKSRKFLKTLEYAGSAEFLSKLPENPYGYPYNPPGFEMVFAMEQFGFGTRDEQRNWIKEQIRRCYNEETSLMDRNTEDPHTQAARLYEAVRLPDIGF